MCSWLAVFDSRGDRNRAQHLIDIFFERMRLYGLDSRCAVLVHASEPTPTFRTTEAYGMSKPEIQELIKSSDLLWNYCFSLKAPFLSDFKRRVLIDLDPGLLQVSGLTKDIGMDSHDLFLTVGSKVHDPDCLVPTLGVTWHRFPPVVHLPMWEVTTVPPNAAFTTITAWNYGTITYEGRDFSLGKRDAYFDMVELPQRTRLTFELAANIDPDVEAEDLDLFQQHGWRVVHPYKVAGSPSDYQHYISQSRAEICCPKPIYCDMRTGWLSDRSSAYLASGRPVLMRETGISDHYPTGMGLITYGDFSEAVTGACSIDANYVRQCKAARDFAEEFLDLKRCLEAMLAVCD